MKTQTNVIFNLGGWPYGRAMTGTIIAPKNDLGFYTLLASAKWGGGEWLVREYEMKGHCVVANNPALHSAGGSDDKA